MWIFLVFFVINIQSILTVSKIDDSIVNEIVLHTIHLPTRLVENKYEITFINNADHPIDHYKFYVEPNVTDYFIKATYKSKNLEVVTEKNLNEKYEKIILKEKLPPKHSAKIDLLVFYSDFSKPNAKTIRANKPLYMQFKSSIMYYSCYFTKLQKKTIHITNVYTYTEYPFVQMSHEKISYGEYIDVMPFLYHPLMIGYKALKALPQVNNLIRIIDASSVFGSITVTDNIEIQNAGPKFVGPFAPNMATNESANSLSSYQIFLPSSAKFIDFCDDIGKISSFQCKEKYDHVKCTFKPRFPLFSGWKIKYSMRYIVPSYEYLYTDNNQKYVLKMRAIDHIVYKMVVKKAHIQVILPLKAEVLQLTLPKPYKKNENSFIGSPLSYKKRTVVNIEVNNAVEENIEDFELLYFFDTWWPNIFAIKACIGIFVILLSFSFLKNTKLSI